MKNMIRIVLSIASALLSACSGESGIRQEAEIQSAEEISPLSGQIAEYDVAPAHKCTRLIPLALPPNIEVWSCYKNFRRFVEYLPGKLPASMSKVDQQRAVRYLVYEATDKSIKELRQTIKFHMDSQDLSDEAKVYNLPPSLQLRAMGRHWVGGGIGMFIHLVNVERVIHCRTAAPDMPNPFTQCDFFHSRRWMMEVQIPNRLLPKLDHYISRAESIAALLEGDS